MECDIVEKRLDIIARSQLCSAQYPLNVITAPMASATSHGCFEHG